MPTAPGVFVWKDGIVTINGVDLSEYVRDVKITKVKSQEDATGLNGNGVSQKIPGLADEQFEITFMSSFSAGAVDATLQPLYEDETEFEVAVTPRNASVAATNPKYAALCRLFEYDPVDAAIGATAMMTVPFVASESIARHTT